MLTLSGQRGDWAIRTDLGSTFITTDGGSNLNRSAGLDTTPADAVTSVNGYQGTVVLDASALVLFLLVLLQPILISWMDWIVVSSLGLI